MTPLKDGDVKAPTIEAATVAEAARSLVGGCGVKVDGDSVVSAPHAVRDAHIRANSHVTRRLQEQGGRC